MRVRLLDHDGPELLEPVVLHGRFPSEEEKIRGCELSVEDVMLMRRVVGPKIGVKASGGIRDPEMALKVAQAGAGVRIIPGGKPAGSGY